jgi:hypothetical protein
MMRAIPLEAALFLCPERAADFVGLDRDTLWRWAKRGVTGYGYPLRVAHHQSHFLVDERDVRVIAKVQLTFPLLRGPPRREKREEMKRYAFRLRAAEP